MPANLRINKWKYFASEINILKYIVTIVSILVTFTNCKKKDSYRNREAHRSDLGANYYSLLSQINKENAQKLKQAWFFHSDDTREDNRSIIECNPIIIGKVNYLTSPQLKRYALMAPQVKSWRCSIFTKNDLKWTFHTIL